MDVRQQLADAMKTAMKARDEIRTASLRMLRAAIINKDKEGHGAVSDEVIFGIIRTLIKQRQESAGIYRQASRPEQAELEEQDAAILAELLPQALSETELQSLIDNAVTELAATSIKDMGRVMQTLKGRIAGQADLGDLSRLVKAKLTGS